MKSKILNFRAGKRAKKQFSMMCLETDDCEILSGSIGQIIHFSTTKWPPVLLEGLANLFIFFLLLPSPIELASSP